MWKYNLAKVPIQNIIIESKQIENKLGHKHFQNIFFQKPRESNFNGKTEKKIKKKKKSRKRREEKKNSKQSKYGEIENIT